MATRLSETLLSRYACRTERLRFTPRERFAPQAEAVAGSAAVPALTEVTSVASRTCDLAPPSGGISSKRLELDAEYRGRLDAWVQRQHECEDAGDGNLIPLRSIRWAKWWVPASAPVDAFSNVSASLDAEQLFAPSDVLETRNERERCPLELFCMQAALRHEVARAAGTGRAAQAGRGGTWLARRAVLQLLPSAHDSVATMDVARLEAAVKAAGCDAERWEGLGWCTPSPMEGKGQ